MRTGNSIPKKIFSLDEIKQQVIRWRFIGKKIAFTNGVFDLLHQGHIASLTEAASHADVLIVGVNSDASVKKIKGPQRPVNDERSRAIIIAATLIVDAVVIFDEDTPYNLITAIMPDVLVKGGDYTIDQIVGAKEVIANGGKVIIAPILEGFSTTSIINKMNS